MNEGINIRTEAIELFYDVGEQIGSGQFAVVKKLHSKSSGETFAAKFIKKKRSKALKRGMTLEQFTREADVLRSIDHKGVIYLHDIFETKGEYVLVLELLSGGELFEFLSEQDFLTEDEAVGFLKQVIEAIDYLHGKSIVHLDIKPENIVLKEDKSSQIKLIDFGLARKLTEGEMVREIMGTPEFVAPEIIAFEAVGTETDMWAIGVLAYIMLSGASPFLGDDVNETFSNISMVDYEFDDEYFKDISMPAKDFISNLLVKDTSERLNAKECLAHEWMQECEDQESANSEDDDVCDNLISPRPTPKDPLPKRRSTMIKTDAFKAFTARARWQKSLNKVIAISRLALLGKKNGPIQVQELVLDDSECLEEVCEESEIVDVEKCEVEIVPDTLKSSEAFEIRKKSITVAEFKSLYRIDEEATGQEQKSDKYGTTPGEGVSEEVSIPQEEELEALSTSKNEKLDGISTPSRGELDEISTKSMGELDEISIASKGELEEISTQEQDLLKKESGVADETSAQIEGVSEGISTLKEAELEQAIPEKVVLGSLQEMSTQRDGKSDEIPNPPEIFLEGISLSEKAASQDLYTSQEKVVENVKVNSVAVETVTNGDKNEIQKGPYLEYKQVITMIEDHLIKPFDYDVPGLPYKETSV